MIKIRQTAKVVLIIFFFVLGMIKPTAALEDAIVAIVNEDVITLKDIQDYLNSIYMQLKLEGRTHTQIEEAMNSIQNEIIDKLIEDKLILSEANKKGIEVRPAIIDERITTIKKRYPSEEEFVKALLSDGSTISDLRNKITDQIKMQQVVDIEVKEKITVNPFEVTEYYNKNPNKFHKPEERNLESIFISKEKHPDDAKATADKILESLKTGGSFSELAKEYSEAPSVGIISKGQLLPNIEEQVFQLDEGEISPIIETDTGYYIFKIKEKLSASTISLEEVKDSISKMLYQEKFKEVFDRWVKKLKEDAFIEVTK